MLIGIKNEIDNPTVLRLIGESAWDKSAEAMNRKVAEFRSREDLQLYGWIENDDILGVCGVVIHSNWIEIYNIAVDPSIRKHGIGKAMITAIQQKYKITVKAETDDDAVGFYQKCGFKTKVFMKTYNTGEYQRYECVLYIV